MEQCLGVIDALNEGFRIVIRKPVLLAIPVLLDLGLLLSPKPAASELLMGVGGVDASGAEALGAVLSGMLILFLALYVPSVGLGAPPAPGNFGGAVELEGALTVIALAMLLLLVGVVISTVWLALLRRTIQPGADGYDLLPMVMDRAPRLLGLTIVTAGSLAAIAIIGTVGLFFLSFLAFFIGMALLVALVGIPFVMFFANLSVILDDSSPRDAIKTSIEFLKSDGWPVAGIIVLTAVVQLLAGLVVTELTGSVGGYVVAVAANAFIGTVLAAGSMVFYLSRTQDIDFEFEVSEPVSDA